MPARRPTSSAPINHIQPAANLTQPATRPIQAADGSEIVTIEGLDPDNNHPLQRAWIAAEVPQCGYCQSGQIMQAASFLASNPNPSDEEIVAAMDGNLCRCMSYVRIKQAIKSAAQSMKAEV